MNPQIEPLQEIIEKRELYRQQGKRVGFTSGVFDILHRGHVEYLSQARSHCDVLIVGVNADSSVKELKGETRPIQSEEDRAIVVSALRPVSHVFIFAELNNNENIRKLKPDVYLKAGDYDRSRLSSASIVESYGGEIVFVPFTTGRSSSSIIDRIVDIALPSLASHEESPPPVPAPAAFLDRDGTLCRHIEYLSDPNQFELLPGVVEGLKKLQERGFRLVIVTNQPGIGFGYFTKEDFYRVNLEMLRQLSAEGVLIDKIYYSPATQAENAPCRKPGTTLGERAIKELNIIRERSIMFGDSRADIEFARRLGVKSCYCGQKKHLGDMAPDFSAARFDEGVDIFLASTSKH